MSNPATDKAQEAFERRYGQEPEPPTPHRRCHNCEWRARKDGYLVGRADLLTELRELPGDEEQRIRNLIEMLRRPVNFKIEDPRMLECVNIYDGQAATDLTTLLDANQALRVRIAELEAK